MSERRPSFSLSAPELSPEARATIEEAKKRPPARRWGVPHDHMTPVKGCFRCELSADEKCPTCNGRGTVTEMRHPFHTCHGIAHDVPCPDCGEETP